MADTVNTFDQTIGAQLGNLTSQTQGAVLQQSYATTGHVATSLSQATPLFDGSYAGTFSGQQAFGGSNFCPIMSAALE